jgi:hypothetical protein
MRIYGKLSITSLYYYGTPLFILLDYFGGINVRVAVLDSFPLYKNVYYGFCILCGIGMYALPRGTPIVALFESAINILLIVLAVFLPYVQTVLQTDNILYSNWEAESAFAIPRIVNLVLAGTVAIFAFHGSLNVLGLSGNRSDPDAE